MISVVNIEQYITYYKPSPKSKIFISTEAFILILPRIRLLRLRSEFSLERPGWVGGIIMLPISMYSSQTGIVIPVATFPFLKDEICGEISSVESCRNAPEEKLRSRIDANH